MGQDNHKPGDCYTFLFCINNSFWSSTDNELVVFLDFKMNVLTGLDVSNNEALYSLGAAQNPDINCIRIGKVHLDRMANEDPRMIWQKDETDTYSLNCEKMLLSLSFEGKA